MQIEQVLIDEARNNARLHDKLAREHLKAGRDDKALESINKVNEHVVIL